METGVITWGPGYSSKRSRLIPCRLLVEAIGLSVHPKDTPVPNERMNLRT